VPRTSRCAVAVALTALLLTACGSDPPPAAAAEAPPDADQHEGCDRYGYVDTIVVHGGWISYDDDKAAGLTNQYAAMPSMHIGWSVWSALVLAPMARRRWARALAWSYPLLTLFAIVVTANHYWIDAVGGAAILAVGLLLGTLWARRGPEAEVVLVQPGQ